jgi:energy-coupling factor transporter ATP-binding protein EcfA2
MSEIRQLLASAQRAEIEGDAAEAIRRLRLAEAWYRERALEPRAEQMRRHIQRLGATTPAGGPRVSRPRRPSLEEEGKAPGQPGLAAAAAGVAQGEADPRDRPSITLLAEQQRALDELAASSAQVTLLLGPEGSGKSTLLAQLGPVHRAAPATWPVGRLLLLELEAPLEAEGVARLLRWLDAGATLVLAQRGVAPPPALVLPGAQGPIPVHDTAALAAAVTHLPEVVLARVERVVELVVPGPASLQALARRRLAARGAELSEVALARLVELALASPRSLHELAALVARVPPGRYGGS